MTKMTVFPRPEIYTEGNFAVEVTGLRPNVAKIIKKIPARAAKTASGNMKNFSNPLARKFVTLLYPTRESNPNIPYTLEERNTQIADFLNVVPSGIEIPWQYFIDSIPELKKPEKLKAGQMQSSPVQRIKNLYTRYVLARRKGMGAVDDTAQILEYERVTKERQAYQMKLISFLLVGSLTVMYFYRKK
jgi:hypothetical protein